MFVDVQTTRTRGPMLTHEVESFCSEVRKTSQMEKALAYAASASRLGSTFDTFLFAPIGEDRNGLRLSVVSALARLGLDPWREAATLAGLPADTAAQKLAVLFRALPDDSLIDRDRDSMATRLIALLPHAAGSKTKSRVASVDARSVFQSRFGATILFFAFYMIVLLAIQFTTPRRDSPSPGDAARATPSLTSAAQTPPAASDK